MCGLLVVCLQYFELLRAGLLIDRVRLSRAGYFVHLNTWLGVVVNAAR